MHSLLASSPLLISHSHRTRATWILTCCFCIDTRPNFIWERPSLRMRVCVYHISMFQRSRVSATTALTFGVWNSSSLIPCPHSKRIVSVTSSFQIFLWGKKPENNWGYGKHNQSHSLFDVGCNDLSVINFSAILAKPPLRLGYGWLITYHPLVDVIIYPYVYIYIYPYIPYEIVPSVVNYLCCQAATQMNDSYLLSKIWSGHVGI